MAIVTSLPVIMFGRPSPTLYKSHHESPLYRTCPSVSGLGRLSLFQSRSSIPSHLVPQVREPELSYHLRLLEFQASGTDAQVLAFEEIAIPELIVRCGEIRLLRVCGWGR